VCDMAGGVWEWVQDEYESSYNGAPTDGSARCNASDCSKNTSNANRVLRGGGWGNDGARLFRVANRNTYHPTYQLNRHGGRVARSIP